VLTALADAGIDIDDVTDKLLRDGIDAFVTPMQTARRHRSQTRGHGRSGLTAVS